MSAVLTLLAIVLLPWAVTVGVLALLRSVSRRGGSERGGARLDLLVTELDRLGREHAALVAGDRPAAHGRLVEVATAYDEALLACCAEVGVPVAGRPPLRGVARLEAEAALAQHGLRW